MDVGKITLELRGEDLRPVLDGKPVVLGETLYVTIRGETRAITVSLQYDTMPEVSGWKITPTAAVHGRQVSILGMQARRGATEPAKSSRARDLSRQRRRKAGTP